MGAIPLALVLPRHHHRCLTLPVVHGENCTAVVQPGWHLQLILIRRAPCMGKCLVWVLMFGGGGENTHNMKMPHTAQPCLTYILTAASTHAATSNIP